MRIESVKKIMGLHFIGQEELKKIEQQMNIKVPGKETIPPVPFTQAQLKKAKKNYLLILGIPKNKKGEALTLNNMRNFFGCNPKIKTPCFYNQNWYLKEPFAQAKTLKLKWYLVRKKVIQKTRGKTPETTQKYLQNSEGFPSAILSAFTFFCYYFLTEGGGLWEHDFIWCSDRDHNGDLIYVGRYTDPRGINQEGFNIHRHLAIRNCYGVAPEVKK